MCAWAGMQLSHPAGFWRAEGDAGSWLAELDGPAVGEAWPSWSVVGCCCCCC